MNFTEDPKSAYTVRRLDRGQIKIGDDTYTENLVLSNAGVIPGWRAGEISKLSIADIAPHVTDETEIVLLGTGWNASPPDRELVFSMARKGIGFEVMDTPAACRTFNILIAEDRNVTAFLLLN